MTQAGSGGTIADCYRPNATGLLLMVRVTPKASKSAIAGVAMAADGRAALAVRIAAPPVEGAANTALLAFIGKQMGVPKSTLTVAAGETSRLKTIQILGDPTDLAARLDGLGSKTAAA